MMNDVMFDLWSSVSKDECRQLLNKMNMKQLRGLSFQFHYPIRGNKPEVVNSFVSFFSSRKTWNAIAK